jgi:VIT1/CCC1 family predicted Fe2+/Mn2+ transporter
MRSSLTALAVGAILLLVVLSFFTHGHISVVPLVVVVGVLAMVFALLGAIGGKKGS